MQGSKDTRETEERTTGERVDNRLVIGANGSRMMQHHDFSCEAIAGLGLINTGCQYTQPHVGTHRDT